MFGKRKNAGDSPEELDSAFTRLGYESPFKTPRLQPPTLFEPTGPAGIRPAAIRPVAIRPLALRPIASSAASSAAASSAAASSAEASPAKGNKAAGKEVRFPYELGQKSPWRESAATRALDADISRVMEEFGVTEDQIEEALVNTGITADLPLAELQVGLKDHFARRIHYPVRAPRRIKSWQEKACGALTPDPDKLLCVDPARSTLKPACQGYNHAVAVSTHAQQEIACRSFHWMNRTPNLHLGSSKNCWGLFESLALAEKDTERKGKTESAAGEEGKEEVVDQGSDEEGESGWKFSPEQIGVRMMLIPSAKTTPDTINFLVTLVRVLRQELSTGLTSSSLRFLFHWIGGECAEAPISVPKIPPPGSQIPGAPTTKQKIKPTLLPSTDSAKVMKWCMHRLDLFQRWVMTQSLNQPNAFVPFLMMHLAARAASASKRAANDEDVLAWLGSKWDEAVWISARWPGIVATFDSSDDRMVNPFLKFNTWDVNEEPYLSTKGAVRFLDDTFPGISHIVEFTVSPLAESPNPRIIISAPVKDQLHRP